jgi:putative ABC transport system substrate-binding protein
MNNRRKLVIAIGAGALASPFPSLAQSKTKIWRIGYLSVRPPPQPPAPDVFRGFVAALRELGYAEGKNLVIEWRYADGKYDRLASLAAELVHLNVDVIVTAGTVANSAAQKATAAIPIVGSTMIDPVGNGFAASLTRPGGNITGLALTTTDASPKQFELLKLVVPKLMRLGVLVNFGNPAHPAILKSIEAQAQKLGIKVERLDARNADGIARNFSIMKQDRTEALLVVLDAFFIAQRQQIADLALKYRLPSLFSAHELTAAGGLMSYAQNLEDFYRRAAPFVDKILKGAKPGDLPIEQPAIFELHINKKTAKALGLALPQELLLRADKVIE